MSESSRLRTGAAVELDRAVALVRLLLSAVASAVVVTHGALGRGQPGYVDSIAAGMMVSGSVGAWWALPFLRKRLEWTGHLFVESAMQLVDTMAFLVLLTVLSPAVPEVAWISLVLPIVIAGLRFGPTGILIAWASTVGSYAGLLWLELAPPGRAGLRSALLVERPAALLAVAAAIAVLAGWLQEGWLDQADMRARADTRLERVRAIEIAGRSMRGRAPDEILDTCVQSVGHLGFSAATRTTDEALEVAVGDGTILPAGEVPSRPAEGQVEVTRWVDSGNRGVYSASVLEVGSQTTISGWSSEPIDPEMAQMLADLVTHATVSYEVAELLVTLREETIRDPLTGLANRRELDRRLVEAAAFEGPVAVLMFDLDNFKTVNDTCGHHIGDELLQTISRWLVQAVADEGLSARYGGDEFTVLLTGRAALFGTKLAEQFVAEMKEPIQLSTGPMDAGVSIGVAMANGPIDPKQLQETADKAVYLAKGAGGGTCRTLRCESPSKPNDRVRVRDGLTDGEPIASTRSNRP